MAENADGGANRGASPGQIPGLTPLIRGWAMHLPGIRLMNTIRRMFCRLIADDHGGEVIEYALILGLIIVTAIAVIGAVGTKVLARWTTVNSSM